MWCIRSYSSGLLHRYAFPIKFLLATFSVRHVSNDSRFTIIQMCVRYTATSICSVDGVAPSGNYPKQCWPRSLLPYGVTRPRSDKPQNHKTYSLNCHHWGYYFYQLSLSHLSHCYSFKDRSPVQFTSKWYDDVIKWKRFPRDWPFEWGINRSPRPLWRHCK